MSNDVSSTELQFDIYLDVSGNDEGLTNYNALRLDTNTVKLIGYSYNTGDNILPTNTLLANFTSTVSNNVTFACSIYIPGSLTSDYTGIMYVRTGVEADAYGLGIRTNRTLFYNWDDTINTWGYNTNVVVPQNQWTHIALVVTPTTVTWYKNGISNELRNFIHSPRTFSQIHIGRDPTVDNRRFQGLMDNIRFYTRALSDAEINKIYQNTLPLTINFPPGISNIIDISLGSVSVTLPSDAPNELNIDISNNIDTITLGDIIMLSAINILSNLLTITLEPSGTIFSDYIFIDISVNSTTNLIVFYNTNVSTTLITDNSNNSTTPYYNTLNSQSIRFFTKSFSDIILGNESGGGIGDPFIKPIFGAGYYLPNDESIYLLFDNNDNLKIYTKTWLPFGLEKKLSYMRYIIIEFNNNRIYIDLETMNFINFVSNGYSTHSLKYIGKPNILNLEIQNKKFTNSLYDYYGKKYKISRHNKQMEIIFNFINKKIILQLNSDSKYQDIRNNINIIFSCITEKEIENYNGALISEQKAFRINETKLLNKNII